MTTKKGGGAEAPRTPLFPQAASCECDERREVVSETQVTAQGHVTSFPGEWWLTTRTEWHLGPMTSKEWLLFLTFFSHHSRCLYTYLGLFSFFNVFPISFRIMASFLSDISLNFNVLLFSVFRIMAGSHILKSGNFFIISSFPVSNPDWLPFSDEGPRKEPRVLPLTSVANQ